MTRLRSLFVFPAIFAGMIGLLAAETMPSKPDRYFNDYAGVIDPATASELNEQLAQFERETSTQLLVVIYRSMQSESSVADYTQRIAQTWGVGQQGRNNGAVLFVFVADRQMFIQTGYGLEGALPDATAWDITHNVIAPQFKQEDYNGGLRAGVSAMMQAVRGEYKGTGKTRQEGEGGASGLPIPLLIFLFIVILFFFINRSPRRSRRGYGYSGRGGPFIGGFGGGSSGGSSGGGFSGFSGGGGSFGGGGAGSSW
ncbi:MAG: TPM domain-containing protein [Verrucomicrobiota bacterium]|nr:TPM domain-containing protein [Verrucomicrobiota bacterium]